MANLAQNFKITPSKTRFKKDFSRTSFKKIGDTVTEKDGKIGHLKYHEVRDLVVDELHPGLTGGELYKYLGKVGVRTPDKKDVIRLLQDKYGKNTGMKNSEISLLKKKAEKMYNDPDQPKKVIEDFVKRGLTKQEASKILDWQRRRLRVNRQNARQSINYAAGLRSSRQKGAIKKRFEEANSTDIGAQEREYGVSAFFGHLSSADLRKKNKATDQAAPLTGGQEKTSIIKNKPVDLTKRGAEGARPVTTGDNKPFAAPPGLSRGGVSN